MELAAQQFLRALRGTRSQQAMARALGYRGNPMADWEHGRTYPNAAETLRAATRVGIDVPAAFSRFTPAVPLEESRQGFLVGAWLHGLSHDTTISALAARSGFSRFSLTRWFSGERKPKLPDFFTLVDVLTSRLPDLVAELVPIASVPALTARHQVAEAARRLALDEPWAEAVQCVLGATPDAYSGAIAGRLGISPDEEKRVLALMEQAQLVRREGEHYVALSPSTVDARGGEHALVAHTHHWASVGAQRTAEPRDGDLFACNVIAVSASDLEHVRARLHATFREIRAIVAASEPKECAALINLQLIGWNLAASNPRPRKRPPTERN